MKISYFNCTNGKNITHFRECFKSLINDDIVFACIGTDAVILDSLGPMVGTMLKKRNPNLNIYGTLDDPITGLNIRSKTKTIKKNHPNAIIIAIDACMVCDIEDIHDVYLLNKPELVLPSAGDYCYITDEKLGIIKEKANITSISRNLTNPANNNITIATVDTNTEDLISKLVNAANTIYSKEQIYNRSAIIKKDGTIAEDNLSNSLT